MLTLPTSDSLKLAQFVDPQGLLTIGISLHVMGVGTYALDMVAHSSSTFLLVFFSALTPVNSSGELPTSTPVIGPADSTSGTAVISLVAIMVHILTLLRGANVWLSRALA
jgi:hypothetical protein